MNKKVKRLIIIALSLLASIAITVCLFIFHMSYGYWWDRPSLNTDKITEIHIYEGIYRFPETQPVLILDGRSDDTKQIINTINKGWYYPQLIKFSADGYQVDVFYSDSKEGYIYIGSDYVSVKLPGPDRSKIYRGAKQVRPIIDDIIKKNPNQALEPTPDGAAHR